MMLSLSDELFIGIIYLSTIVFYPVILFVLIRKVRIFQGRLYFICSLGCFFIFLVLVYGEIKYSWLGKFYGITNYIYLEKIYHSDTVYSFISYSIWFLPIFSSITCFFLSRKFKWLLYGFLLNITGIHILWLSRKSKVKGAVPFKG